MLIPYNSIAMSSTAGAALCMYYSAVRPSPTAASAAAHATTIQYIMRDYGKHIYIYNRAVVMALV